MKTIIAATLFFLYFFGLTNISNASYYIETKTMFRYLVCDSRYLDAHYVYVNNSGKDKWWVYDLTGQVKRVKNVTQERNDFLSELGYMNIVWTKHQDLVLELISVISNADWMSIENQKYKINEIDMNHAAVALKNPSDMRVKYYTIIDMNSFSWKEDIKLFNEVRKEYPNYLVVIEPIYIFTIEKSTIMNSGIGEKKKFEDYLLSMLDLIVNKNLYIDAIAEDRKAAKDLLDEKSSSMVDYIRKAMDEEMKSD